MQIIPLVNEANELAEQMKRDINLNAQVKTELPELEGDVRKLSIEINVENNEVGYSYNWTPEQLQIRIELMRDWHKNWSRSGGNQ